MSPTGSHGAVILYSNDAETVINFNQQTNVDDFSRAVQSLPHQKGRTRIDRALQVAYQDLFGPRGSARRGVQKIAVILTDGEQTKTPDAIGLDEAASPLKREGVFMISVGIGKYANRKELRLMTDSDDDVIMATSFDDLQKRVVTFEKKACEGRFRFRFSVRIELL
jgi:hypothetical protein